MRYSEYFKKADNEEKERLKMSSEEIKHLFTTPLGELEPKYRNLIKDPEIINDKFDIGQYYNAYSIEWIVNTYCNIDIDLDIDDSYNEPYFVYKDHNNEPCGFIVYIHNIEEPHNVSEIILFSFNAKRKDFGRQIWIDFEKDLRSKKDEGFIVKWQSKKSNPANVRYDAIVKRLDGYSHNLEKNIVEYVIGEN